MQFMDEVWVGDRCVVTDFRDGKQHKGAVVAKHDEDRKVDVKYDEGQTVRVGVSFVQIEGEE